MPIMLEGVYNASYNAGIIRQDLVTGSLLAETFLEKSVKNGQSFCQSQTRELSDERF